MSGIRTLSWSEKLDIPLGVVSILAFAIKAAVTAPFRGDSGAYTFGQHVAYSIARKFVLRFSTAQLQYINPTFSAAYKKWYPTIGGTPEFVTLKSGSRAFWVGDYKTAKYIMVYYHGGGFSLDGDPTHLQFWHSVQTDLEQNNIPVAILFSEYTLVPHATHPTQLIEAIEALEHVKSTLNRPASQILIGGDSAGGNLCLGVLSQLMHPSKELPSLTFNPDEKLKAIVLVAPWLLFGADYDSAQTNRYKDLVSKEAGDAWSSAYLGGKEATVYADPGLAPAEWWKHAKAESVLAVAGADELLVDAIRGWAEKFQSGNPDSFTLVCSPHEGHIAPIINIGLGLKGETEQGKTIKTWLKAKL